MLRYLQVLKDKPIQIVPAGKDLTRGGCVVKDIANNEVLIAGSLSGNTPNTGFFLVDNAPNYNGINAIIAPTDADFENIVEGDLCLLVPTFVGERYATTEVDDARSLSVGDALIAVDGMFSAASGGVAYEWVYGGTYSDPTGLNMYIVERVSPATTPGE